MFHSFENSEPTKKRRHKSSQAQPSNSPIVYNELRNNGAEFSDLFYTTIMAIQEDHRQCQLGFNILALDYMNDKIDPREKSIVDNVLSQITGHSMSALIQRTETKLHNVLAEAITDDE